MINLLTKRFKLNLLFNPSYMNSNFALTLGYLNPALNNPAQESYKQGFLQQGVLQQGVLTTRVSYN